jgi:hypothetical protein
MPLGHFRDAGQLEIQVTRPAEPVQFDQGGRRNAKLREEVVAIAWLADEESSGLAINKSLRATAAKARTGEV